MLQTADLFNGTDTAGYSENSSPVCCRTAQFGINLCSHALIQNHPTEQVRKSRRGHRLECSSHDQRSASLELHSM